MTRVLHRQRRAQGRASALCALLLGPGTAIAAVDCSVSTAGVAFGAYDVTLATPDDSTGTLTVTCTRVILLDPSNVSYVLALSRGTSGSYLMRQMASGANRLNYNLYANAAHSQVWGDGTGSSVTVSGSLSFGLLLLSQSASHTMYGRVPALQDVASSSYSDAIVVTITF
jgi:spore coat protein U-like protein